MAIIREKINYFTTSEPEVSKQNQFHRTLHTALSEVCWFVWAVQNSQW